MSAGIIAQPQQILLCEEFEGSTNAAPNCPWRYNPNFSPPQLDGASQIELPMQGHLMQHLDWQLYPKDVQTPGIPLAFIFIFTMPAEGGQALGIHWDDKIQWTPIRARAFKMIKGRIYYSNRLDKSEGDLDTGQRYVAGAPQGLMILIDEKGKTRLFYQDGSEREPASAAWQEITPAKDPFRFLNFNYGTSVGVNNFIAGPVNFKLDYMAAIYHPELADKIDNAPKESTEHESSREILYPRNDVPEIAYGLIPGDRYEAIVPDTLDLAERAAIGVHGLSATADPDADCEIYGLSGVLDGKLALQHSYHDFNGGQAKYIETLALLRSACGSSENINFDPIMFKSMLKMIGSDGIYTTPVQNMPFQGVIGTNELLYFDPSAKRIWNAWPAGRVLLALCAWYEYTGSAAIKAEIEHAIDGLTTVALPGPDGSIFFPHRKFDDVTIDTDPPTGVAACCFEATMVQALAVAYRQTRYEPARELAEKITCYMRGPARIVNADGTYARGRAQSIYTDGSAYDGVHFHATGFAIIGMLDLALATGNRELAEFAKKAYESARAHGEPVIGWFPEYAPAGHPMVETCQVADMVTWAVKLSAAGLGDYWEDVEHIVRNHLQSAQSVETWWMERAVESNGGATAEAAPTMLPAEGTEKHYETNECAGYRRDSALTSTDRVADRIRGTFVGMTMANGQIGAGLFHCCVANGNRGFYFPWRHIVDEQNGELKVNLLLNRASKWADVDSYLPYRGTVVVCMKTAEKLRVRIPSWVAPNQVKCDINDKAKPCELDGRYLVVGDVQPGDVVTVNFPLERRTMKIKTYDHEYTIDVKGFNVIDIWPRDNPEKKVMFPFYTRTDYREDTPRMKKVVRYAPERELEY